MTGIAIAIASPNRHPVVVGVDEGDVSHTALRTAFELAHWLGVELTAVYAMSPQRAPGEVDIPSTVDWKVLETRPGSGSRTSWLRSRRAGQTSGSPTSSGWGGRAV